jgi:hypothetical protein
MPFRDHHLIRVMNDERLPDCCIWCAQTSAHRVRKTFYWHGQWLYLLLLLGALPYVIIALILRQKMVLDVPLCGKCFAARRKRVWIGVALLLGLVPVGIVVGIAAPAPVGAIAGLLIAFLMFLAGLLMVTERLLIPTHIDEACGFGTFRGASPKFLRMLPTADE